MLKKFYLFSILSLQVLNTNAFDRHQLASSKPISSLVTETYAKKCFKGAGTSIDANGSCGAIQFKNTSITHRGDNLETSFVMQDFNRNSKLSSLGLKLSMAIINKADANGETLPLRGSKTFRLDSETICDVNSITPVTIANCSTKLQPGELSSSYQTLLQQRVASLPKVSTEEREYRDRNYAVTKVVGERYAKACQLAGKPVDTYGSCGEVNIVGGSMVAQRSTTPDTTVIKTRYSTTNSLLERLTLDCAVLRLQSGTKHYLDKYGIELPRNFDQSAFADAASLCEVRRKPGFMQMGTVGSCLSYVKTDDLLRAHASFLPLEKKVVSHARTEIAKTLQPRPKCEALKSDHSNLWDLNRRGCISTIKAVLIGSSRVTHN